MAYFDAFAKAYDSWYETLQGKFVDMVETDLVFQMLEPKPGMKLLDIGCGTGIFSLKLANASCDVEGVDVSRSMVEFSRDKAKSLDRKTTFHVMDGTSLHFADNTFDAALSVTAIEFVENRKALVSEAIRVVKPGGKVLFCTINRDSSWGRQYVRQAKSPESIYHKARFLNLDELSRIRKEEPVKTGECLYIPANAEASDYTIAMENKMKQPGKGGFICILWQKK